MLAEKEEQGGGEEKGKMEAPKTIEHQIGGVQNDALRFGLQGVKSDLVGSHPLESAYESVFPLSFLGFCCSLFSIEDIWSILEICV